MEHNNLLCISISDRDRHKLYVHTNKHKIVIVILHGEVHGIVRGMGTLMWIRWEIWYGHGDVPEEVMSKLRYELFIRKNKNKNKRCQDPVTNIPGKDRQGTDCFTDCFFANICWLSELSCGVDFGGYWEVHGKQNIAGRSIRRNKAAQRPRLLVVVRQIHFLWGRLDSHHEVMQRLQLDALNSPCPNSYTRILDKSMGTAIFRP